MKSQGFSLIEILIALVILSVALLGLAGLMAHTTRNNSFGGHMTEAAVFAQDKLEELRVTSWDNIVAGTDVVMVRASTGINYTRNWAVVPNVAPPNDTLKTVTISIRWNDGGDRVISLLSALSR